MDNASPDPRRAADDVVVPGASGASGVSGASASGSAHPTRRVPLRPRPAGEPPTRRPFWLRQDAAGAAVDQGPAAGDGADDRPGDDGDDESDDDATATRRLRAVPRDAGRALADRAGDTIRMLRPLPDADIDRRLGLSATTTGSQPVVRAPRGGTVGFLDRFQRKHTVVGFPLAVAYKFFDDQGGFFAAMLAYYGFVSLFPLLLLLLSISGFVLHGDPELQRKLLNSALRDVPVLGQELRDNLKVSGSGLGLVVGLVGTLYGSLGLAQACQTVFNRIYSVPRNARPNPLRSRWRSLRLLPLLGLLLIVTSALSALPQRASVGPVSLGPGLHAAALALSITVNIVLFLLAFRLLTAQRHPVREIIVGATVAGVAWQGLQYLGAVYLTEKLSHASEVYGVFGIVLGSITWIYLEALVVVLCAEINVVLHRRLWPRALLTPFTDDVDLTPADRRAYAGYARAERFKGFQRIDVGFDGEPEADEQEPDADQRRLF